MLEQKLKSFSAPIVLLRRSTVNDHWYGSNPGYNRAKYYMLDGMVNQRWIGLH